MKMRCCAQKFVLAAGLFLMVSVSPSVTWAEIIWSGDFETGHFRQWHESWNMNRPFYWAIPDYGRPPRMLGDDPTAADSYFGDGSLMSLVTNPVRQGKYAAKFTVKNSANGSEPADCDGTVCTRRRTTLEAQSMISDVYNGLPYQVERWLAFSVYVPADWESSGSGWGPVVFSIKPRNEYGEKGLSGWFEVEIARGGWKLVHRWSPLKDPTMDDIPWQQGMFYTGDYDGKPYPRSDFWPEGLVDFPDVQASHAALHSLNLGGWTDWVVHMLPDARGSGAGGVGFLTVWKREDSAPWVKVLHVQPKTTTRGGVTFDHGIGYNSPPKTTSPTNNGGFGVKAQLYMEKGQVWNNLRNRVLYFDNIKIGDQNSIFGQMSPDGSAPEDSYKKPDPPKAVIVE
jgi:hypothetical protein